tara:strand:+ start:12262 stop:13467 length:1206 start_codon:yes stop_codon:yes gene_type:complete
MGDINQINDVAAANINQVNDVAKANISEINDQGVPASGATAATRWVVGMTSDRIGYAANSNRTAWTFVDSVQSSGEPDAIDLGYGKDNSGNGIYVIARISTNKELHVSGTDITSDGEWTAIDLGDDTSSPDSNNDIVSVRWRAASNGATAGIWMVVGRQTNRRIYRSTDGGANWSAIDISGLTGHATTPRIMGIDGDGTGKWMFGQAGRIYYSTDDGASWAVSTPFSGESGADEVATITGIKYTNSSWVIAYENNTNPFDNNTYIRSCAASDITDWSDAVDTGAPAMVSGNNPSRTSIASYQGRICVVPHKTSVIGIADISGKTISNVASVSMTMSNDDCRDVATDGVTWMIVTVDGDVWESTDNAASWSKTLDNMGATNDTNGISGDDSITVTPNVYGPL